MQVRSASMDYQKRSISKPVNIWDVALKFVWAYTDRSLSKVFEVSFGSSFGLFSCIKAMAGFLYCK